MKRRVFFLIGLCSGLLLAAGCDSARGLENAAVSRMAAAMIMRLHIAEDVAWSKANTGAPVLDREREAALLADLVRQGEKAGVAPERTEKFFRAQITASREVQTELLAAWRAGTTARPRTPPLDLRTQIRPRMDAASGALMKQLVNMPQAASKQRKAAIADRLCEAGFSETVSRLAADGL